MRAPLLFLLALALPSAASAACPGKFAALAKYVGDDPARLLQEPAIRSGMRALAGPRLARLDADLAVRTPVALIDCELVVEGNAPHAGSERNAIVSLNLGSGEMTVGMLEEGRVTILAGATGSDPVAYGQLPAHVRDWALVAANAFRSRITPPPNVTLSAPRRPAARGR